MYTIAVWNKRSTNYNANAFVEANGTETLQFETASETLLQMGCLMDDPQIKQIVLDCPTWWKGRLIWVRPCRVESNECDGCSYDIDIRKISIVFKGGKNEQCRRG